MKKFDVCQKRYTVETQVRCLLGAPTHAGRTAEKRAAVIAAELKSDLT
jgi:hypothetical protein